MFKKLGILVIFLSTVFTLNHTKALCRYSNKHKLRKIICSDFNINPELEIPISPETHFEKLVFKNITGYLDLSNVTLDNLRFFLISHSRIEDFLLGNFPELIFLNFLKNEKFPNLTKNLFMPVTQINWLSLVSNNHTIAPNAFHLLENLTWLHIQNQKVEHLTGEFLEKNTKLHELAIRNCHIDKIDADAFDKLKDLEILSLNYNNLRRFENGTFKNLKKLKFLELHNNKLFNNFNLDQFSGLNSVEILGLPSAFLRHVEVDALLATFPKLKKIEMKKRDLRHSEVKELIKLVRKNGIDIIGTPHDCRSVTMCNVV